MTLVIRSNILYAFTLQWLALLLYLGIAYATVLVLNLTIGLNIIDMTYQMFLEIDTESAEMIIDLFQDVLLQIFLTVFIAFFLSLINIINNRLRVSEGDVEYRRGKFMTKKSTFPLHEIVRVDIEKDWGIFNTGYFVLHTHDKRQIRLPYVVNLEKAKEEFDKLLFKTKMQTITRSSPRVMQDLDSSNEVVQ